MTLWQPLTLFTLARPDLLLVPIGGGQFVMNPADAAWATRERVKPKAAVPMHDGTTPALSGTPQRYIEALGNASTRVMAIQPGDTLES